MQHDSDNPIAKRMKQGEQQVVEMINKSTNRLLNFYSKLKQTTEGMPSTAHAMNVLLHSVCNKHPLLTKANSYLELSDMCQIEPVKDGLLITIGADKLQGCKTYLGVKVFSESSKELSFWTRKSGEKELKFLSN